MHIHLLSDGPATTAAAQLLYASRISYRRISCLGSYQISKDHEQIFMDGCVGGPQDALGSPVLVLPKVDVDVCSLFHGSWLPWLARPTRMTRMTLASHALAA